MSRESFVAVLCDGAVLAPFYKGTCHVDLFNFLVEKFFVLELGSRQVVILDKATFHKSEKIKY